MKTSEFESVKLAKKAAKAQLAYYKMMKSVKKEIPNNYYAEKARTSFSKAYNNEGSYYCPECGLNTGSVWYYDEFRPTKYQALCCSCRSKYLPERIIDEEFEID